MQLSDFLDPQAAPVSREGAPSLHDVAIALHAARRDHGQRKYDSLLQTFNGRSAEVDRLQEVLDGVVYELQRAIEATARDRALRMLRVRLGALADRGGAAHEAVAVFEEFLSPSALARYADELARELIEQAR